MEGAVGEMLSFRSTVKSELSILELKIAQNIYSVNLLSG
jgi:hypothetical protein